MLIQKDSELKDTMNLAAKQGNIDKNMKSLQEEVQKQDNCIRQLQKQLKDAETLLVRLKPCYCYFTFLIACSFLIYS